MNPRSLSFLLAVFTAAAPAHAKLTVHEWGTFTVLQAPDGTTLQWYLASRDIAPLPPFVKNAFRQGQLAGKTGTAQLLRGGRFVSAPYSVRMETPVLYFYPDAAMDVKVSVNFPEGEITEFYPSAATTTATGASWHGGLLPVTPESLKSVPEASGPLARHYAAARAVPEAWIFRNTSPPSPNPAPGSNPPTPPASNPGSLLPHPMLGPVSPQPPAVLFSPGADHFIFYRGAGNAVPMSIRVTTNDDRAFTLANFRRETVPVLFILRVANGKAAWRRMDNLRSWSPFGPEDNEDTRRKISLPEATEPLVESTAGLKTEMLAVLEKEGLTKSEAAAMVATWDNLWFEEPGTRVLAVLPQSSVDAALPLQITPKPDSIERVFVARLELISLAQQNTLAALLDNPPADPAAAREQLQKLALGRFAPGAVERVTDLKKREMENRFVELSRPEKVPGVASVIKSLPEKDLKAIREGMKRVVESSRIPQTVPPAE